MVDAVTATNAASKVVEQDSAAENARRKLSGDFDTFLLLLTTQLKNQDPVEPLDTHQFTSQLVQFASVEQAIDTNSNLEEMIDMQSGSEVSNAVNYIGKFVQATGNSGRLQGGVAAFSYHLPQAAATAEVSITTPAGQVVYTGTAPSEFGKNDVIWDGSNSFNGTDMPNGIYNVAVVAKDSDGNKIEAETYTTGFVTGVSLEDGKPTLQIGEIDLSMDKVLAVRDPLDFAQN